MIIYSQSQSHYESAKSKLKAGDLCFIGDEKKIIFHKSAEGGDPVVYEGTDDFIKKSDQSIKIQSTDGSQFLYFGTNYIQFKTSSGTTLINHSSTAALRLITLPDKSGTLATTSDIPDISAYASLLDYITVVEDNGETFHSLNDNTMVAGQFAATDLIYSDNALVSTMIWGDNLYGGSVTCDSAEFGALTLTGNLTSSSKIETSGIIQGNEGYINTQYITANLFSLNDENTIRMGGNFKIRAYGNASGSISASGNISSDASIYATDSLYAGSSSQTGYVRLYEKNSTDYTRFSKSQLRIAGDVSAFEITGAAKTTGNLTAGNMLFVENDSYLKGSSYTGAIYLHYGNQFNIGSNFDHMVINYNSGSGEQTLARICDGQTNAVADFQGSGIEFYTSLTVPSLSTQSFSTNSFNASSLSVGNVSVLDSCVSVGDVHVYNEDLSYSDLEGSIQEVELLSLSQILYNSCNYSYTYNLKKGDTLNLNGGLINVTARFDAPSSDASSYFIYKTSAYVGGSLVAEIRAGSTIYSNGKTSGTYSGSLGTDSYTATEDCQITVQISCSLDLSVGVVTCSTKGTITKTPSSGANTTLLAKNAIGLLYDSQNYFIVGMDNGVMKMKFVSGGVSMFDSTYSAPAQE